MPTLRIAHAITDFAVWSAAFAVFGEARRNAGVREARIHQPVDDASFVLVDLDFDSHAEATAFLRFLQDVVWQNPANSPALVGRPEVAILDLRHVGGGAVSGEGAPSPR